MGVRLLSRREDAKKARARAELVYLSSPVCEVCKQRITTRGLKARRHHSCEEGSVVGRACICPSGCSEKRYGDGGRPCDPSCVVCRVLEGTKLKA